MLGAWMQKEIEEQIELLPVAAPTYARQLRPLQNRPFDIVLLVARGSSDHAALYARYLVEVHLGIPAVLAAPSVLTRYHRQIRYPECLAIGISQSGSAPDVAEVVASLRQAGHATLGITNTPGSLLAQTAEYTLHLDLGEERSVAATKTYTASLLALYQIVRTLGGALPEPELPNSDWLDRSCQAALVHAPTVAGSEPVFSLGRGYAFATAEETALKLMECALIPCKAYSTADFEHGPKELAREGSAVIAFEPLSPSVAKQGATILSAPVPPVPEEIAPVWQAIYGQWLALTAARLRNENPDQPEFIRKITKTL